MPIFAVMALSSLLLWVMNYQRERRSLWMGFWTLVTVLCLGFFLVSTGFLMGDTIVAYVLRLGLVVLVLVLLSGPLVLYLALVLNGIQVLKKEGLRWTNALSLGLAVAIAIYVAILPKVVQAWDVFGFLSLLYITLGLLFFYLVLVATLYSVSAAVNLWNLFPKKLDYVVVLGAGLNGDQVTPLLAGRIDKGIGVYRKQPGSRLIVSGGQGPDELVSEAQAMAKYAVSKGVPVEDILLEDKSTNTRENLLFSRELMEEGASFAIATNNYHVFRSLLLARELGMSCSGYGSRSKFYFSLNAYIREFAGYLVMKRNLHLKIFLSLFGLWCLGLGLSFVSLLLNL